MVLDRDVLRLNLELLLRNSLGFERVTKREKLFYFLTSPCTET